MRVVIPAAGAGKRFIAEGVTTPKELLRLGGQPLIAYALAEASRAGFESAVVVVSPTKRALADYISGVSHPLPVATVVQHAPLGIGDAVLRCWQGEPFAVLLPDDVVLGTNHWSQLLDLHRSSGAATLCVKLVAPERTSRFGIAEVSGDRVIRLVEKPAPGTTSSNLAVFGRYVVTEAVCDGLQHRPGDGELELTFGFAAAISSSAGVRAVPFADRSFDCGTPADYATSTSEFIGC